MCVCRKERGAPVTDVILIVPEKGEEVPPGFYFIYIQESRYFGGKRERECVCVCQCFVQTAVVTFFY